MATSGTAYGTADGWGGRMAINWYLVSQDPHAGAHGRSTIRWVWAVGWPTYGDCYWIQDSQVIGNGTVRSSLASTHTYSASHRHTGYWPAMSPSGGGFATGTYTIDHDEFGEASVSLSGYYDTTNGRSSASETWPLPRIPQTVAPPTGKPGVRVSDAVASLSWVNHSTEIAPYRDIKVYRRHEDGDWALRATLGVVTTYTDTSLWSNHKYQYRVSAVGLNGIEVGYATGDPFWTTPAAPTNCTASKQAGGSIKLTWANNVNYAEYTTRIEESKNGGPFTEIASVAAGTTSWTHVEPSPGDTHQYRVRARTSSGTTLYSGYSTSGVVQLLSTAYPPTHLSPSGTACDADGQIIFSWLHNPSDGTPQTSYRLRYQVDGGDWTVIGPVSSADSQHVLPASTLTNGCTVTWQVASAGENGALSAYSAEASFVTSAAPTATISAPAEGVPWPISILTVKWAYYQSEDLPQVAWTATLYTAGGETLEVLNGSGDTDTCTFGTVLQDGTSYTVRVRVTSAAGLQSEVAQRDFEVDFLPPAMVHLAGSYDRDSGCVVLTITGDDAEEGVTVDIDTVDVERSINGGPWVAVASGVSLSYSDEMVLTAVVLDTRPTIHGDNIYRARAHSALPSSVMSAPATVATMEEIWAFLGEASGTEPPVRMFAGLAVSGTAARARKLFMAAGRELPVALSGQALTRTWKVQALLESASSRLDEVQAVVEGRGAVLYRDPSGLRVFATPGQLSFEREGKHHVKISFALTQTEFTE